MKIKFTQIILIIYLIIISIITKNLQLVSWILLIIALIAAYLLGKNRIFSSIENLTYILIALVPFPYLLFLFLLYLPFAIFGLLLTKRSFTKSYILGFAVSLIPTILLYTTSNYINFPLSFVSIALFFYLPIVIAIFILINKNKPIDFLTIDFKEYFIILIVLASTIFVANNIVNDHSLFISNSTYMYSKFDLIVKSIQSSNTFPIYDPSTSSGESPFLFETPLFFSHLAFANIMLNFIPGVTFYNLYSLFILFLSTLALSLLLRSMLNISYEMQSNNRMSYTLTIILGVLSIGLNFYFIQYLEAFKEFFTFPINYLIFSLILDKPKKLEEITLIFYMIILSFITHTSHGVGILLMSFSLVFLILTKLYFSKEFVHIKSWLFKNKVQIIAIFVMILLLPLFYIAPVFIFGDFLEAKGKIEFKSFVPRSYGYVKEFVAVEAPLSLHYPDITRNDDKKFGPFISIFGLFALAVMLILFRLKKLSNFRLFFGAYLLHFLVSAVVINHPVIGSLEYAYRTAAPYLLILLVVSICSLILLFKQEYIRYVFIAIFFISFIYTIPLAKSNIENIHKEEFISGKSFENEINLVKNLPKDGRIITYGLFANTIDPGMAALTDRYFSRYHLTEYARSRTIYWKIHGTNSFGQEDFVLNKSGAELSNYLSLGGYKYIFANICHPVGNFISNELYPDFTYAIYQNSQNPCFVFFVVNKTNYAEKVSVLKDVDEEVYKTEDGFKYYTLSKHFDFGNNIPYSQGIITPEALDFVRDKPTEIKIFGDFNENDWVVFKEDYFSRWKAFMDGKEVPVLANNHNSVLIRTIKGTSMILKYAILPIEKFFGIISFIAALLLLITLLMFLRK